MNQEPNPPLPSLASRRRQQWLKIAGYIALLLLVAWLYSVPQDGVKPAEQGNFSKPSSSAEAESRGGRQPGSGDHSQKQSARRAPPPSDDDRIDSSVPNAPELGEGREQLAVVRNVRVTNEDGRVIYRGDVDIAPTLDRIDRGARLRFSHDGIVFENREKRLPIQPSGYYHEFIHPTPDDRGPGGQRVVLGRKGEVYYTPDHYKTFRRVR